MGKKGAKLSETATSEAHALVHDLLPLVLRQVLPVVLDHVLGRHRELAGLVGLLLHLVLELLLRKLLLQGVLVA